MTKTTAQWTRGMAFELELQGRKLVVDATEDVGGKGLGPQPKGLMLSALAGCTGMDVVSVLRKKRVNFDSFAMDIVADTSEAHPKVYEHILIQYQFEGAELEAQKAKILRSIELSLNNYCGVANTLKHCGRIEFELYFNGKRVHEGWQGEPSS